MKIKLLVILSALFINTLANDLNSLFDVKKYHGNDISYWFPNYKTNPDNKVLLLDKKVATQNFINFKCHFYNLENCNEVQSPWAKRFVDTIINNIRNDILTLPIDSYFRFNKYPMDKKFFSQIFSNIDYLRLRTLKFNHANFAITTSNTVAYILPTDEPVFKSESILGQGYPFNLNIISSLPIALPLYVLFNSHDKLWSLVLTPYFIGWIRSDHIAYVDNKFMQQYQNLANNNLISIVDPKNIVKINNNSYQNLIPGTIVPNKNLDKYNYQIYLPYRDYDGRAKIYQARLNKKYAYSLPYPLTKEHILDILVQLINRAYGWGGYLNYTDCSLEMQVLWQVFGYFVPRNSSQQIVLGNIINLSNKNTQQRLNFLNNYRESFTSLIFIKGHIMLYLGTVNYESSKVPLIYNNIWGLLNFAQTHKYIIGSSNVLPLLESYFISDIQSLINYPVFQIIEINRKDEFDVDMTKSIKLFNLD